MRRLLRSLRALFRILARVLLRLGGAYPEPGSGWNPFRPEDRFIFHYFDGTKIVRRDPMEIDTRLEPFWAELRVDLQLASPDSMSSPADKAKARAEVITKVKAVFDVESLSQDGGLTLAEQVGLLNGYLVWSGRVKKNSSPLPTSAEVEPTASPPSLDAPSVTSNGTDSGSTVPEALTGEPQSWNTESELPLEASPPTPDTSQLSPIPR